MKLNNFLRVSIEIRVPDRRSNDEPSERIKRLYYLQYFIITCFFKINIKNRLVQPFKIFIKLLAIRLEQPEEEIEGYHIVRAILYETIDPERVVLRDFKNFCNVLLDGTLRKPICRFYFNTKQKLTPSLKHLQYRF